MAFDSVFGTGTTQAPASTGAFANVFSESPTQKNAPAPPPTPAPSGGVVTDAESIASQFGLSLYDNVETIGADALKSVQNAFSQAPKQDILTHPAAAPIGTVASLVDSLTMAGTEIINGVSDVMNSHKSALDRGLGAAQAGLGTVNAMFAPINSVINYAQYVPGLGYLATSLNAIFGAVGSASGDIAIQNVDQLPVSQATKDKLTPIVRQLAALTGQILVGGIGMEGISDLADKTKSFTDTMDSELQGAEAATEVKNVPVAGESASQNVPVTKSYTRIAGPEIPGLEQAPTEPTEEMAPTNKPLPKGQSSAVIQPVEGTGVIKTATLSAKVEADAVTRGLADSFPDLPASRTVSMEDQGNLSLDYIMKNPDEAKEVAMGTRAAPKGVYPESVFVALEKKATAAGDIELIEDLTQSKLALSAKAMGQRIRILGERDATSPTEAIQIVQAEREAELARKGTDIRRETVKGTKEVMGEIRKLNTRQTWEDFIGTIIC